MSEDFIGLDVLREAYAVSKSVRREKDAAEEQQEQQPADTAPEADDMPVFERLKRGFAELPGKTKELTRRG